jgi:carbohydrate kinase (thermoresistant glucokinase family)
VIVVVMGPAGSGKTTVGQALAHSCGWDFVEGDLLHPPANVEKMRAGHGLTDADREPWLAAVRQVIVQSIAADRPMVVTCSALKQRYREILSAGLVGVQLVYLQADRATLERRLAARAGHFAGPALVDSQLAALEEPAGDAITIDATQSPDAIVAQIRSQLPSC